MKEVLKILPRSLSKELSNSLLRETQVEEIRLRVGKPVFVWCHSTEKYLTQSGQLKNTQLGVLEDARMVTKEEITEAISYISRYSRYAYEEEMKQGFFTIKGGHRIGLGGQVLVENGQIRSLKQITFLNIRIAYEVIGCADFLLPYLYENKRVFHTLIASGPGNGKTTLLRDLIRQISNGTSFHKGVNVGVVDERSEISACFLGIAQNDVGVRTDILDACPKEIGMKILLRSMTPTVIAVDEIGTLKDFEAIRQVIGCGCTMLATAHCEFDNPFFLHTILENTPLFERFVLLGSRTPTGQVVKIYNEKRELIQKINRKEG